MGRRRRDGQRRAAKVEARRRRREAMARPRRSGHGPAGVGPATSRTPRVAADVDGIVPGPGGCEDDLRDDLEDDDPWDELDDDLDDDLDDEPGPLDLLQDRIRLVVADTVRRRDPEVARAFVVETPYDEAHPFRSDRTLIDLVVASWLAQGTAAALGPRPRPPGRHLGRRAPGRDGAGRGGRRAGARPGGRGGEPGALPADTARRPRRPDLAARRGRRAGPGARPRADRRPECRRRRPPPRPGAPVTRGTGPDPGDTPGPGR